MQPTLATLIEMIRPVVDAYNLYITPFWPTISQMFVLLVTLYGIRHRWIPQISDIFNPNSAAEIDRAQFPAHTYNIYWNKGLRLTSTPVRITWNYVINVGVFAVIWSFILWTQFSINHSQMQHYNRAITAYQKASDKYNASKMLADKDTNNKLLGEQAQADKVSKDDAKNGVNYTITAEERDPLIQALDGPDPLGLRYARLILWTELLMCLPLICGVITMRFNERRFYHTPDKIDRHGLALVGTFSLIGLLNMAITEWRLGINSGVGWVETFLPFLPLVYVAFVLFSPYNWTEKGKRTLNTQPDDFWPDPNQLPPPVPTLNFMRPVNSAPNSLPFREPNHSGPLVMICASGGGSRAALFTAGILNRMWWQAAPLDADTIEALNTLNAEERSRLSDVSLCTNPVSAIINQSSPDVHPGRLLLQYADAISSVSGGSLAMGYFVESLHRDLRDVQKHRHNPCDGRFQALQRFFTPTDCDTEKTRPPIRWYNSRVRPLSLREFFSGTMEDIARRKIAENESDLKNFEANPYINAMQQDHLAATMCGFFRCWEQGRGPGIESFWEQAYQWWQPIKDENAGLSQHSPVRLRDFYRQERDGSLPVLILNATITRTGTRLAITNLDTGEFLPMQKFGPQVNNRNLGEGNNVEAGGSRGRLTENTAKMALEKLPEGTSEVEKQVEVKKQEEKILARAAENRFDPLPGQINTLNELDARWSIPLKTAVRASANFPFGFPLMRLVRRKPEMTDPKESEIKFQDRRDVVEICDGGLIDNTGLDSVLALIRANRADIKERGILLFQIDSGELPRNPGKFARDLFHHFTEAKNAMWRANLNLQSELQSEYIEELQKIFDDHAEPVKGNTEATKDYVLGFRNEKFAYFRVRLGETTDEHVMTSWHLDAPQRALLYDEVCAPQQGEAILCAAQWLAKRVNGVKADPEKKEPVAAP